MTIDRIGHNPQYPVTDNWSYLVDEVIDSIASQSKEKVVAMGHSLGGVLTMLAAIRRPDLIRAVVVIESPLIGPIHSTLVRLAKHLKLIDRLTPSRQTKGRRSFWATREQVKTYLLQKKLFSTFTSEALNDYIDYGLQKSAEGYSLRFDKSIEALIYRTIPHTMPSYGMKLNVPTYLLYGKHSNVMSARYAQYMARKYNVSTQALLGTHMLPMEKPQIVARYAKSWLSSLPPP